MGSAEADSAAEPAHEAQAETAADVDPIALTVMASADADMAAISRCERQHAGLDRHDVPAGARAGSS
jgi:hypothetical protein